MMTQQDPLERYKVIDELGSGAVGKVYAARDQSTGAAVALKILDPALLGESSANLAALFLKNARSAARLRHRNIVKILDAGEVGGTAYIAMELLEGESLRNLLDNGPLPTARAIQIFDDIASALAYAHEEGVIHRGVKPSNIIVLRSGAAKLCDFGIGQIGEPARRYMSPEQVRGEPVDHRSDLFSLGTVFYEMLTRVAPFQGNSPKEIGESILRAEPPPPSKVNPHIPGALDGLVLKMLARDPDQRFADARILLRDLQRAEEGLGARPVEITRIEEPAARQIEPAAHHIESAPPAPARREPTLAGDPFYADAARFRMDRLPEEERSSGSRATSLAALALLLALLSVGVALFWNYSPSPREPVAVASRAQEAPPPAVVAAPPRPTPPPPVTEAPKEAATAPAGQASSGMPFPPNPEPPKPLAAEPAPPVQKPNPPAQAESLPAREPEPPAIAEAAPAPKTLPAPQPAPRPAPKMSEPQPQPGGTATLIIAVSPQGEVYIDGKHYGTTPPITTLDLEPGMRRIEIRSGSRKPYLTYMTVEAGDERRIRHDFAAKPIRPPR